MKYTNILTTIVLGISTIIWILNANDILFKLITVGLLWSIYSHTVQNASEVKE